MSEFVQKMRVKLGKRLVRAGARNFLRQHPKLKELIAEINRQSESVGLSDYKYASLYQMVRRLKPRYVLECGTGKSTFVIALAMVENGNGKRLVSLEESGRWAEKQAAAIDYFFNQGAGGAARWFPAGSRKMVELIHSKTVMDRHRSWAGIRYAEHKNYSYDFILVDGPALTHSRFIDLDLVHVLKHFSDTVSIWIDGRWAVAAMCRALFGDKTVHRAGWSHTQVYSASRRELDRDIGQIGKEMTRMLV